jgi:dCTP diphosphatase
MNPIVDDYNTPISFFKLKVQKFVRERRWTKYHTPKNLIHALSIEVAELSEIFLFKDFSLENIKSDKNLLENISDEIADVFIYLTSLLNSIDLDLTKCCLNSIIRVFMLFPLNYNHGIRKFR